MAVMQQREITKNLKMQSFTEAFIDCVKKISGKNLGDAPIAQYYEQFQLLQRDNKPTRIWQLLGQKLSWTTTQAHDFYYNTWQNQFYQSISPFRDEIKTIVAKELAAVGKHYNKQLLVKDIMRTFMSNYEGYKFNEHQLQQTINTIINRLQKQPPALQLPKLPVDQDIFPIQEQKIEQPNIQQQNQNLFQTLATAEFQFNYELSEVIDLFQ